MQNITSTNTLIVVDPIMSPLFIAQLISVASYNKLSAIAQQDFTVYPYTAQAHATAINAAAYCPQEQAQAQANINCVYTVNANLSYTLQ